MNELELKKFQARNLQGRMKHLSHQLEYLKVNPEDWENFQSIINMKFNHLINDSISLGSVEAANYLALLQNHLNENFNSETITIVKDQFDEVLDALDGLGVELLINTEAQSEFTH
ncbi:hypothetical protein ACRXCV_11425 [Halobacteriovorax sp. GFR7]|uniref:hypothetical protein n=1 Tax=unclassified Halobacteriovorax TaxID=2639665 RepID=UPI003D96D88D